MAGVEGTMIDEWQAEESVLTSYEYWSFEQSTAPISMTIRLRSIFTMPPPMSSMSMACWVAIAQPIEIGDA
jgi:hypothetical protein